MVGWALRLLAPAELSGPLFGLLVLVELAIPIWAERTGTTSWHPGHIAERYGLFTLIVLGETVLAATTALQLGLDGHADGCGLVVVGVALTVFAMWWVYFSKSDADRLTSNRVAFVWGYGHYLVFASAAAVGAGVAVQVDRLDGHATLSRTAAGAAVTLPVAVFVLVAWALHVRPHHQDWVHNVLFPLATVLVLLATLTPQPVLVTGLVLVVLVATSFVTTRVRA